MILSIAVMISTGLLIIDDLLTLSIILITTTVFFDYPHGFHFAALLHATILLLIKDRSFCPI